MEYRKIGVIGMIVVIGFGGYLFLKQGDVSTQEMEIEVVMDAKSEIQPEDEKSLVTQLHSDLNIGDEYAIMVLGMKGDFVKVAVNTLPEGGGYGMIVMEQAEKYIQVYAGQEYPSCIVVDQYKIPKEMAEVCLVSDDSLVTDVRENVY